MEENKVKITIEAARINAGLTQEQAAEKIGCSKRALVNYEKGENLPRIDVVQRMEEVYGVKLDNLIFKRKTAI